MRPVAITAPDPRFVKRSCPNCFADRPEQLFQVSPAQFIQPSYDLELQKRFSIKPETKFPIVRCRVCSFVYAELNPSVAFATLLYDAPAEEDNLGVADNHPSLRPGWVAHQLTLASLLLREIDNEFGAIRPNILDFGCGFGALVRALNGPSIHCTGYETSRYMIRYMTAQGLPVVSTLSEVPCNLHGILLSDVLEHLPEPRQLLRELHNLLIERGILCLNVLNFSEDRVESIARQLNGQQRSPSRSLKKR